MKQPKKVRVGIGIGAWPFLEKKGSAFFDFVAHCDEIGVDSLWFSDRILGTSTILDPIVAMSALAGCTTKMKFGTSTITLPVRNPVVLAKELATLDFLSNGRVLPVIGLGQEDPSEYQAAGISKSDRGRRTDEAILLMRALWEQPICSFEGAFYQVNQVSLLPKPVQQPGPPLWIGGRSEAALRRVAFLGDGWLASFITPQESGQGIERIQQHAEKAERIIPDDHFGAFISCAITDNNKETRAAISRFNNPRTDGPAPEKHSVFGSADTIIARIREYELQGVTKFVLRPVCPPESWLNQVNRLAQEVILPVQTPFTQTELEKRAGLLPISSED